MPYEIAEITEKMRDYFKGCTKMARGEALDERGRPTPKNKREIASLAGLCVRLDIGKGELMAMERGDEKERKFFDDMLLEYEVCACAMRAASMIDDKTLTGLRTDLFSKSGSASDNSITLIMQNWNAPDDWEDYLALIKAGEEHGLTLLGMVEIIENYRAVKANDS